VVVVVVVVGVVVVVVAVVEVVVVVVVVVGVVVVVVAVVVVVTTAFVVTCFGSLHLHSLQYLYCHGLPLTPQQSPLSQLHPQLLFSSSQFESPLKSLLLHIPSHF